jgi:NOL1/NOP2/fmu family ribosome biogenesis protein
MCAARQREILRAAAKLLRPGGRLVYSTCTFAPEENEETVAAFLEEHPDFAPMDVEAPWFAKVGVGMFRLWPHKLLGEGHFVAVLQKAGEGETSDANLKGEKLPKEWDAFAKETGIVLPTGKAVCFGETVYWAPAETPELKGLRVLRVGLELGEVRKGRFVPSHALALWLKEAKNMQSYPAQSKEIADYLHGDVVPSKKNGWCLVMADGYSIGWGKGDGNVLKNHYPKGLRR